MKIAKRFLPKFSELLPLYIVFVLIMFVYYLIDPSFLTVDRFATLSMQLMPIILATIAQTIIMLTNGVDLSIGSAISLGTTVLAVTMTDSITGIIFAILFTILVGVLVGLVNGTLVAFGRLPAIIVTLATSYLWQGVALFILSQPGGYVARGFTKWINSATAFAGLILIIIALAVWYIVKNTRFGVAIYAIGDNRHGAFVSGIKVNKTRLGAYALAGGFAAFAAIGLAGFTGTGDPTIGEPYTLETIAAAVLGGVSFMGGKGKIRGAVIGAIIIGSLMNILFFTGMSIFYQYIVQGVILILAVGFNAISISKGGKDS